VPLLREPMRLRDRAALSRRMRAQTPRATTRSIAAASGGQVSHTFVHELLTGQKQVCSREVAAAIAGALTREGETVSAAVAELFEPAEEHTQEVS
jgi:nicotinamide mononucleotide (NMN) deamidase PncC